MSARVRAAMGRVILWVLVLALTWSLVPILGDVPTVSGRDVRSQADSLFFGILNDSGAYYADEWQRGVRATNFELHWKRFEPEPGVYDLDYILSRKQRLAKLKAQGWRVQLVPGYQYVPDWVFATYPDMRYLNQYGDAYDPDPALGSSFRVINAPFNPQARALIAAYIARIFQEFDPADFDSVRVGGGVQGELRYPPRAWNGHGNSYWAYDAHAQDPSESGIPTQVVGWRPGIDPNPGSVGRGQLIVNHGFEQVDDHLPIVGWAPEDEVQAQLVSTDPRSGSRALQVTISTPHRIHQFVRVAPSVTYDFGGWLRAGQSEGRAQMFLNQYDAGWQLLSSVPFGKLDASGAMWQNGSGSLDTSSETQYLKIELGGDRPGSYLFDDLWLKRSGEANNADRDIDVPLAFYKWYVESLTSYQNWQVSEIRKYYGGQLDVIYAGKGLRSHQLNDALTNDLRGDGWVEDSSALYAASVYERHLAGLDTAGPIALYLTGVDEPTADRVDDTSAFPSEWSAARWIAYLAQGRGLPVWGENSGQDDVEALKLSAQRAYANHFLGLMWAFESELYADPNSGGYATIDDYEAVIQMYANLDAIYLPMIVDSP